jgi:large conductance mechanosensitive channel
MFSEFRAFILRGNVVELAVAVIMGAAFGAVVTSLVKDVFTPLLAAIIGEPDFSSVVIQVGDSAILVGSFLNALLSFVLIATAVFFFLVKPVNAMMARFNRRNEVEDAPAVPADVALLTEIRDLLRAR